MRHIQAMKKAKERLEVYARWAQDDSIRAGSKYFDPDRCRENFRHIYEGAKADAADLAKEIAEAEELANDLLAALRRLLESPILIGNHPESVAAFRAAQAAIAKAEGK